MIFIKIYHLIGNTERKILTAYFTRNEKPCNRAIVTFLR